MSAVLEMQETDGNVNYGRWIGDIVILFLGGIMVGIDQATVGSVMPALEQTFHFSSLGAGLVGGIQSISEGLLSFLAIGWLADKVGSRKKIMIPSLICFGITSWLTGVSMNFGFLLVIRFLMGIFSAGWLVGMFAKSVEDAPPKLRAFGGGLTFTSLPIGLGILAPLVTPVIVTDLGWRPTFWIVGIPAIVVALIAWAWLSATTESHVQPLETSETPLNYFEALKHKNVVVSGIVSALAFGTLTIMINFGFLYLTKVVGLTLVQAGAALSGWGIGGAVGAVVIPVLSDWIGRKWLGALALLVGAVCVYLVTVVHAIGFIFILMIAIGFTVEGADPLYQVLIPGESVPTRLRAKADSLVLLGTVGIGGGAFSVLFGGVGQAIGLQNIFYIGVAFCLIGAVLSATLIRDTSPRRLRKQQTTTVQKNLSFD